MGATKNIGVVYQSRTVQGLSEWEEVMEIVSDIQSDTIRMRKIVYARINNKLLFQLTVRCLPLSLAPTFIKNIMNIGHGGWRLVSLCKTHTRHQTNPGRAATTSSTNFRRTDNDLGTGRTGWRQQQFSAALLISALPVLSGQMLLGLFAW